MARIKIDAMILVVHLKLWVVLASEPEIHDLCVPDCDEQIAENYGEHRASNRGSKGIDPKRRRPSLLEPMSNGTHYKSKYETT